MLGRIMVFIAGLVVVALVVALVAPYFVDWTGFRQDFERRASLILGKKVEVHGAVSARLIPFPSVTMDDVTIGRDEDGKPLVSAKRFAMDMEIAPFLSGEARIFEMRIIEPKVHIALQKDGTLDWAKTGNPSIPAKIVVLENVRVSDGELVFEDHQTGRTRTLSGLNFTASAKSLAGPWRFEGKGALDGMSGKFNISTGVRDAKGEVRIAAHVQPEAVPVTADLEGTLKLENLRLRYDGSFTAAYGAKKDGEPAPARVKGTMELTSDRVRLPQYQLDLGNPTDPYSITGEATLDTGLRPQFLLTAEGQQIDMNAIGASGEDGKRARGEKALPAAQRLQAFLALLADIPVPPVPGKATLKLPAIVSGDTAFRDISVVAEPHGKGWKLERAAVELPGRTKVQASGLLDLSDNRSFKGELTVASSQPSGLSAWLAGDIAPEIRGLTALGFSSDVTISDRVQQFDNLELAAGGAILKGQVVRQSPDNGAASLAVNLSGGDLDLDVVKAVASLATGKDMTDAFFAQTISAQLNLQNLAARGTVAHDVRTGFSLSKGVLKVDTLNIGDLAGAAVDLTGTASGTLAAPVLDLSGRLRAGDPRNVLLLASRYLPHHPALSELVDNAHYFANANLGFTLQTGKSGAWPISASLDGTAKGTKLSLQLQAQDIALSGGSKLGIALTAENDNYATLMGQAGFTLLPSLGGRHGLVSLKIDRPAPGPADIALNVQTDTTGFNAKGKGDLSVEHFLEGQYKVLLDSENIEPFLLLTGNSLPNIGDGLPLSVSGTLDIKPGAYVVSALAGKADQENIAGNLLLTRDKTRTLTGDLSLKTIDAGWLSELVAGPLRDGNGALSGDAIPPGGEAPFVAKLKLSAATLWFGYSVPVQNFSGRLDYRGGSVAIEDGMGEFAGGAATGAGSLTTGDGQAFLRGKFEVKSADLRPFSWHFGKDATPVVAGRVDLSLGLESSGDSMRQLMARLSGSGKATLPALDINGLNAGALPRILDAADKIEGDINAQKVLSITVPALEDGQSHFDNVVLPFSITSGRLHVQNATASNDKAQLTLDASVGVVDNTVKADLRTALKAGDDAVAGADPAVDLRFTGTLVAPTQSIDVTELSNYLSLRAFERERRKADLLQARLAERQRLRREALYYQSLDDAREKARIEAEKKAEAEAAAAKAAAEKAAADKAAAEKVAPDTATTPQPSFKNPADQFNLPGFQPEVIRGGKLAPLPSN